LIFTGTPEGVGKINKGDKIRAELTRFTELNVGVE
jgi:2-keto-4-pentenoate hydratase/2-oxohepta-3-ene-1,7-dioic acid hydratase in catechol pathway